MAIIDLDIIGENWNGIEKVLSNIHTEIIGITSVTPSFPNALKVASIIKASQPDITIVMGGPHVTFKDKCALDNGTIDIIVRGEGEYTLLELVEAHELGSPFSNILGISFKDAEGTKRTPNRPLIENLDELPLPARHLVPLEKYGAIFDKPPNTSMITSRGCPFRCTFCAAAKMYNYRWRERQPEAIVQEMEILKHKGFPFIVFFDDIFTLDMERVVRICELLQERDMRVRWMCESRADSIAKYPEVIKKMKEAGCEIMFIGVESGVQQILDKYLKGYNLREIREAFDILRKNEIMSIASFIIGHPDENTKAIKKTVDFAKMLDPDFAQFCILTPFPGTEIYDEVKTQISETDYMNFNSCHAVYHTKNLSEDELMGWFKKSHLDFYLRPKKIIRLLRKYPNLRKRTLKTLVGAIALQFNT